MIIKKNGLQYKIVKIFKLDGHTYYQHNGRMTANGLVAMCFDENGKSKDIYKQYVINKHGLKVATDIFNSSKYDVKE